MTPTFTSTSTPGGYGRFLVVVAGQLAVSSDPTETLITHGLGSALGVTAYDRIARVGALVHTQLSLAPARTDEAHRVPARFVETGVAHMLAALYARGARKDRIELRAAGGARTTSEPGEECFGIGRRNVVALKKVAWQNGVLLRAYEVGGAVTRTLSLCIEDGMVELTTPTTARVLGGDLTWF
jgi:chemotaxis protein CheD